MAATAASDFRNDAGELVHVDMGLDRQAWGRQARRWHQVREREHAAVPDAVVPVVSELFLTWQGDTAGHPLGRGMPSGTPVRLDGESHSNAQRRLLRWDPCSYCSEPLGGTVDHIEPRASGRRWVERWTNLTGACSACNEAKAARPMLLWLLARARHEDAMTRRSPGVPFAKRLPNPDG